MYIADKQLKAFLSRLPKTETHLHIEGALPWELLCEIEPDRRGQTPAFWAPEFRFKDFAHFEGELLGAAMLWYRSPEHYHRAAKIVMNQLFHEENVRYLETSFASGVLEYLNLDGPAVIEAIKTAAPEGMTVRVFMGIHHNGYTEQSRHFIDACPDWEHLDGIDLHGTETIPMEDWAAPLWKRFRDAGKVTKAHAGEFCGADFVRSILDTLQVKRVQHGVRSIEDPQLVEYLVTHDITLDVCPISNLKLGVVPSMEAHPIRKLWDAGVSCTVSTDDPFMFGNALSHEYVALNQVHGFSPAELKKVAANGFRIADMAEAEKQKWLKQIAEIET